jgi:mannonate dehydratase
MYLGTQTRPRDDSDYRVWAQLGVTHVCVDPPGDPHRWSLDDLQRHREHVEKFGLTLDMVQLPMSSAPLEKQDSPHVLLGREPDRRRELDSICRLIERIGAAGIPAAKYNLNIIGIPRTADEPGRGGSRNAAFRWRNVDQSVPPGVAGTVSEDENWQRIDVFLRAVVPVAEAAKVRLACHPHDPYTPPGYRGVTRVLGTVDGLKRFVTMHESRCHGLNFRQGAVAEMLDDPGGEIDDVIRWFGTRGKLFNVHFRNIRGRKLDFMEVFPDEGDMDMALAAGVPRGRLPVHAGARPRSGDRWARSFRHGVRLLLRLHPRPYGSTAHALVQGAFTAAAEAAIWAGEPASGARVRFSAAPS